MPKALSHFFAYLSRMRFIRRWGLMRNTLEENIQEHSLQVALIAHVLAVIGRDICGRDLDPERAMALGAYHEVSEVMTGDLPSPIKHHNPRLTAAYGQLEDAARDRLLGMLPAALRPAYEPLVSPGSADADLLLLVKAADKLSAYLKCVEELKGGNQEFSEAEAAIGRDLAAIDLPEVTYFMEHFAPSFSLTLDELT